MTLHTQLTNTRPNNDSRRRVVALLSLYLVLAGCGGGGGDDEPPPPVTGNAGLTDLYCALGSVLFGGVCVSAGNTPSCTVDPFGVCVSGSPVTVGPRVEQPPIVPMSSLDIEPNDDFSTPSAATFGVLDQTHRIFGFETSGTINPSSDLVDNFIFTAPQPLRVTIQLCELNLARCNELTAAGSLDDLIAHIEVFDQNGNLLATTANDVVEGNLLAMSIDAGVAYYVSIVAGPWMLDLAPQTKDYFLRVVGWAPSAETPPAEPERVQPNAPELFLSSDGDLIATLDWLPPTQNSDGTALLDLQGYVLYFGDASGGPYQFSERLDAGLSSYVLSLPDYGIWNIAITAVDAHGVESALSNEVSAGGPPPDLP